MSEDLPEETPSKHGNPWGMLSILGAGLSITASLVNQHIAGTMLQTCEQIQRQNNEIIQRQHQLQQQYAPRRY